MLNHPNAGVLSALGIGLADVVRHRSCGIERRLDAATLAFASERMDEMQRAAEDEVRAEGVERIVATRSLDVRYEGVESYLTIPWAADGNFAWDFTTAHRTRYGYVHEGRALEILAARVEVIGRAGDRVAD